MNDVQLPDAVKAAGEHAEKMAAQAAGKTPHDVEATPEKPAAAPEPDNKTTEPEPDSWEHKYNVAQGRLIKQGKELSELNRVNPVLVQQITDLRGELMQRKQKPPKPKVNLADIDGIQAFLNATLSEEELETFEDEIEAPMVPILVKLIKGVAGTQVDAVSNKMESIERTQANTLDQQFNDGLTGLVPDWEALNADNDCIAWLKGNVAAGTDQTYLQLLNYHNQRYNFRKVAEIFNLYKDSANAKATEPTPPDPLAGDVEPGGRISASAGNPTSSENDERIWKSSEIKQFYRDRALGRIKDDEAKTLEAQIDRANLEGRIEIDLI